MLIRWSRVAQQVEYPTKFVVFCHRCGRCCAVLVELAEANEQVMRKVLDTNFSGELISRQDFHVCACAHEKNESSKKIKKAKQ